MTLNRELLLRVKAHILEEPRRFDMWSWKWQPDSLRAIGWQLPSCGTVACIGGWAAILSGKKRIGIRIAFFADVLGLTVKEARPLLFQDDWPIALSDSFEAARVELDYQRMAELGAERIDRFLAEYPEPANG